MSQIATCIELKFAQSLCAVMSCFGMSSDQFADAANIDRDDLKKAMNTGRMEYTDFANVVSFLRGKTKRTLLYLPVNQLILNYDATTPSITLLGGPWCGL